MRPIETVVEGREKPIVHSDRGWPLSMARLAVPGCKGKLGQIDVAQSMLARTMLPVKGFFGRLKTEMFYPRGLAFDDHRAVHRGA
jgi:putative transposase